jgi:hypothetical protein
MDYQGVWFLPTGELEIKGCLTKKKKKHFLLLFTDCTFESKRITYGDPSLEYLTYPIINGKGTEIFGGCTLLDCQWAGTKKIGENLFRVKYEVRFAFTNALISNDEQLKVNAGLFSFEGLATWYDGRSAFNRLSPHTGVFVNGREQPPDMRNRSECVRINDSINLHFIDLFGEKSNFRDSFEYTFAKLLRIEFKSPHSFSELLSAAISFASLLEVSFSKKIRFKIHSVEFIDECYTNADYGNRGKPISTPVLNYTLHKGKKIADLELHGHHMLISGWKFKREELANIIRRWFENGKFEHIYDYFIDSHIWAVKSEPFLTNVMFNNRFLNMLHGIEGFHELFYGREQIDESAFWYNRSEVLSHIKNPALKEWLDNNLKMPKHKLQYGSLREKLNHLIDDLEPYLKIRFGTWTPMLRNLMHRSVFYRNNLSHGIQDKTYQGDEFNKLFFAVQYILAVCIIKSLGLNDASVIKDNTSLDDMAREVLFYLKKHPDVYAK